MVQQLYQGFYLLKKILYYRKKLKLWKYKLALLIIEILNHEREIKEIYWSLLFQKTALRETKSTLHHFWLRLEVRNFFSLFVSLDLIHFQSFFYFVRNSRGGCKL